MSDYIDSHVDKCSICLDEHEPDDLISLACRHDFGRQCLETWAIHHTTCPICRDELPAELTRNAVNYDDDDGDYWVSGYSNSYDDYRFAEYYAVMSRAAMGAATEPGQYTHTPEEDHDNDSQQDESNTSESQSAWPVHEPTTFAEILYMGLPRDLINLRCTDNCTSNVEWGPW